MADPTGGFNAGIAGMFPQVAASNPLFSAAVAGEQNTTAQGAAGQQLTLQDIINQSQQMNLQNQQADQPNIAAQRQLTGMNLGSAIQQQPDVAAAKAAEIKANVSAFTQKASEDDIKTLHQGIQGIEAAGAIVNSPDFDPLRDSDRVNDILNKSHPGSKHEGLLTPMDIAKIRQGAQTAPAVRSALEQTMGQGQGMALEGLKAKSSVQTAQVGADAHIQAALIDADAKIKAGLYGALMAAGGNATKFSEELIKMPPEQRIQALAEMEKQANGGVISDDTYNQLINSVEKQIGSNDQLKSEINKESSSVRDGILAGDLVDAKRKAVKAGVITQAEADGFGGTKNAFAGYIEKQMIEQSIKQKAQTYVDKNFPQHSPKVSQMDVTEAGRAAVGLGGNVTGALNRATTPAAPAPKSSASPPTSAAEAKAQGLVDLGPDPKNPKNHLWGKPKAAPTVPAAPAVAPTPPSPPTQSTEPVMPALGT